MKRTRVLFGQRRFQVLATMAVLLLAVSVVMASGANFTASKANPGNIFTAGTLAVSDNVPGAILTMDNMVPGSAISGDVTIENVGTVNGAFSVSKTEVSDAGDLGAELNLTVTQTSPVAADVYNGPLDGDWTTGIGLGTWGPGAPHTYHFVVTWPTGTPANDNALMGATCEYGFTWNAVSL